MTENELSDLLEKVADAIDEQLKNHRLIDYAIVLLSPESNDYGKTLTIMTSSMTPKERVLELFRLLANTPIDKTIQRS
jgi:hypothetical protein